MRGRGAGWVALAVSLLVVGVVRSAIPPYLPDEYEVTAREGTASMAEATVELLSVETASAIRAADEWSEAEFVASEGATLVLARVRIQAHGGPFVVRSQLRTDDGYSYDALPLRGFPQPGLVHVGVALTTTLVYEVPKEKVSGVVAVHGSRSDGLQPVAPYVAFPLPADLDPDGTESLVEEDVWEPVP